MATRPAEQIAEGAHVNREQSKTSILVLAIAAVFFCFLPAHAEVAIKTEIGASSFFVGEGFVYTLTVNGAKQVEEPETPIHSDFFVNALETKIQEHDSSRTFIYRYRVIPRHGGLLNLPSLVFSADGEVHETEAEAIKVAEAKATDAIRLDVTLGGRKVYAGEAIVLTFTWYSTLPLNSFKALDIRVPPLSHASFDVFIPAAERVAGGKPGTIGLPVEGQRVIAKIRSVEINRRRFTTVTFRRILVPRRSGTLKFPSARLLCSHLQNAGKSKRGRPSIYPSYFDNDFFHAVSAGEKYVRYGVRSKGFELEVLPLPEEGRPENFSGIVGAGKLTVEAEPQTMVIGEPITLTLRMSGFKHPEALALPPLAQLADLRGQFLVPDRKAVRRIRNGEAVFAQSIRPLRTAVTVFPAIELVAFNPQTKTYEALASNPVPLRIRPDGERTSIELPPEEQQTLKPNADGIWHNLPVGSVNPLARLYHLLRMTLPVWLLLPSVVALALSGPARRYRLKQTDLAAWRRLEAFRQLKRALTSAASPDEQHRAVCSFFGAWLDIEDGAVTLSEILEALKDRRVDVKAKERESLQYLLEGTDLARFGRNGTKSPVTSKEELLTMLREIQRRLER
jgi:hypothetical protein